MKNTLLTLLMILCANLVAQNVCAAEWNAQDYDLYAGDFNGDGKTDILYIAKDPSKTSGIALSDGTAPTVFWQSWSSTFLNIPWSGNQYSVIVADFNGDGKADIFLQSNVPGDNYLLLTDATGHVTGITQTVSNSTFNLIWSADQHKIIAGDFNGDGKADLFLQATSATGINAIVYADANGEFSVGPVQTPWTDGYLGLKWSTQSANVYAGDFNGDHLTDLLVQAKPQFIVIGDDDLPIVVPFYPPAMNAIVYSQGGTTPFTLTGVSPFTWGRMSNGVDWSPLTNTLVVGDFNGDGIADVLLQAKYSGQTSYLLTGNASGSPFSATPTAVTSNVAITGDSGNLIVGNFDGIGGVGLYVQALTATGTNYITNSIGSTATASATDYTPNQAVTIPQAEAPYTTATRYNVAGQVTGTIAPDPDGSGPLRLLATRNTYDATGLLIEVEQGQLTSWPDETHDPSTWANYGFSGANIFSTTLISYDTLGRKIQELGQGRNLSAESEMEYSYDSRDHVLCKAVRMSKSSFGSSQVDACTQRSTDSTQPDRIYRYTYDGYDQVVTEERGIGTPLAEVYVTNTHNARRLTSQMDANGNLTQLTYDETGYRRLQTRVYPSPTSPGTVNAADYNAYTYDANGNVQTERKRNGTIITNSYDADNHLTTKHLSDHTYAQDTYYDYDASGLMLHAAYGSDNGPGIYTTYDGFGHVATSTDTMGGASRMLSYQYDNNGNRTRITHPDSYYFQYGFDGLDRMYTLGESTAANSSAGTNSLLTATYQNNGSPWFVQRNGSASVSSITLDNANRVMSFTHDVQGTANDLTNTFTYNAASQIIQLDQSNTAYSYLGNNNKTGAYVPDGLNRYTSINGQAITYDLNQNLSKDGSTTYTYDMENHLVAVTGTGLNASFIYDPTGKLFQSTINGTTTQFLYDSTALVAEYVNGALTKRYVHGDQVDHPLVQYVGSSVGSANRQYLYADHQGSIIADSDANGNVLDKYAYDNYGIPENTNDYRFAYTGQIWFKDVKLYYYKARFYSPYLGRFMQTDPIFYKDDMDLYAYVGNDPMDKTDPSGLKCEGSGDNSNCTIDRIWVSGHKEKDKDGNTVKVAGHFVNITKKMREGLSKSMQDKLGKLESSITDAYKAAQKAGGAMVTMAGNDNALNTIVTGNDLAGGLRGATLQLGAVGMFSSKESNADTSRGEFTITFNRGGLNESRFDQEVTTLHESIHLMRYSDQWDRNTGNYDDHQEPFRDAATTILLLGQQ